VSIVTVGQRPRIWTVNEGDEVMETDETTDSNRTEVFEQAAAGNQNKRVEGQQSAISKNVQTLSLESKERRTEVDGVDLALDLDDRALAAVDGDDLLEVDVLENNVVVVFLVLLKPLFTLIRQWFARRQ
jgi:hypothetical protein